MPADDTGLLRAIIFFSAKARNVEQALDIAFATNFIFITLFARVGAISPNFAFINRGAGITVVAALRPGTPVTVVGLSQWRFGAIAEFTILK